MAILHQRDYMIQIKNSMLLHFNHKDISFTLRDLNEHFESGKANEKTEAELCGELGDPKDLAANLLYDKKQDKFTRILSSYIIQAVGICILIAYVLNTMNPIFWCIPVILIPVYIWHLCGGMCLYEFQTVHANTKQKNLYIISFIISFITVIFEQIILILLNTRENIKSFPVLKICLFISYYVCVVLIVIFIVFSGLIIYRLYYGIYSSLYFLSINIGMICSSLSYITYIKFFNGINMFSAISSLPYIFSIILSISFFQYASRKR